MAEFFKEVLPGIFSFAVPFEGWFEHPIYIYLYFFFWIRPSGPLLVLFSNYFPSKGLVMIIPIETIVSWKLRSARFKITARNIQTCNVKSGLLWYEMSNKLWVYIPGLLPLFYWVSVTFQGRTVKLRGGSCVWITPLQKNNTPICSMKINGG